MTKTLVTARDLGLTLGGHAVLDKVSLTLEQGRITTLIGPNGAGKSTLARLILGLAKPDHGHIERRPGLRTGYMPQHLHLDESLPLTVDRFLWLAAPGSVEQRRAALERTGVAHLQQHAARLLSGGETQRVLLARALLRRPDLLVLDEPAQGVDVAGQDALYALLDEVRDETGCGILLISHDLHLVMARSDQVICLHHHVCCSGTPEDVARDPAYQKLFGTGGIAPHLAVYTHHHDHDHGLSGEPREESPGHGPDHGERHGEHRHD